MKRKQKKEDYKIVVKESEFDKAQFNKVMKSEEFTNIFKQIVIKYGNEKTTKD